LESSYYVVFENNTPMW